MSLGSPSTFLLPEAAVDDLPAASCATGQIQIGWAPTRPRRPRCPCHWTLPDGRPAPATAAVLTECIRHGNASYRPAAPETRPPHPPPFTDPKKMASRGSETDPPYHPAAKLTGGLTDDHFVGCENDRYCVSLADRAARCGPTSSREQESGLISVLLAGTFVGRSVGGKH